MKRQLQILNGAACGEWRGSGAMPVAPSPEWNFVDVTDRPDAVVGSTYDVETDTFTPPPPPPARPKQLSRFEFMGLLTPQERIALKARRATDPILDDAFDLLDMANHVEPSHPMIAQMLGYVQQIGVMSADRRAAFVAAMAAAAK